MTSACCHTTGFMMAMKRRRGGNSNNYFLQSHWFVTLLQAFVFKSPNEKWEKKQTSSSLLLKNVLPEIPQDPHKPQTMKNCKTFYNQGISTLPPGNLLAEGMESHPGALDQLTKQNYESFYLDQRQKDKYLSCYWKFLDQHQRLSNTVVPEGMDRAGRSYYLLKALSTAWGSPGTGFQLGFPEKRETLSILRTILPDLE